ncbi:MAG: hypothetical protein EAZ53_12775 [Bacteroidetes bacterium]|nr:MAG: hypothetical protein EAZ53_12775 [Bacteroidota bacterium]
MLFDKNIWTFFVYVVVGNYIQTVVCGTQNTINGLCATDHGVAPVFLILSRPKKSLQFID